ncbi:AMP-binding protein, partial [Pelagicoccus sp. SDUM812002]|uniref:AMP-binding enzyme n=1 Tax=Pelagicoccus sp. SDUM812002 TaxID=3041266 RepID=UPI0028126A97
MTSRKFVPDPFSSGERMYRSGDLARWLPDGNLEFLGRIDDQVKVRGFRVELGEVESALCALADVRSGAVAAREVNGETSLVAYVVSAGELDVASLRSSLGLVLPGYMVPSFFIPMDALPLTSSGKLDRNALPAPDGSSLTSGVEYAAPR